MTERQCILLVDDDSGITEALSYTLERPGRTIVLCSDVESAEIALARFPVTHLVTDLQFSGDFGFEGLHFLGRVFAQRPNCRIVLITGYATDALRSAALKHGAAAVLAKPFDTDELEAALGQPPASDEPYEIVRIPPMEEILAGDSITAVFQPIVRLGEQGATIFGYEALTRMRESWLAGGPVMLFDYAARRAKLAELNIVTMIKAIEQAALLPQDANIFCNIDPLTFEGPQLSAALTNAASRAGLPLERVVLEVTERSAFADDAAAMRVVEELRARGVRFALDDHGSAYSHLALINRIRPSFVKISTDFGIDFEEDRTKSSIVRHTVAMARDFGCETILEGIETPSTAHAAIEAGVTLAQGFHFGRPHAASHWTAAAKASLQAA